jgi:hypothetical protein
MMEELLVFQEYLLQVAAAAEAVKLTQEEAEVLAAAAVFKQVPEQAILQLFRRLREIMEEPDS